MRPARSAACLRLSLRSGKRSLHIREMNRLSCEVQQSTLRLVSGLPATLPPREASCFIASLFLRRSILSVDNCRQPTAPPPVRGCSWPPDGRVVMGAVCLGSFHLNNLMIEFDLCLRRYRSRSLIDRAESSQPSPARDGRHMAIDSWTHRLLLLLDSSAMDETQLVKEVFILQYMHGHMGSGTSTRAPARSRFPWTGAGM
jgi:hypothetical protein